MKRPDRSRSPRERRPEVPVDDVPGAPARRAALRLLDAVLRRGLPLEAALDASTRDLPRSEDRALAHALAAATLRRLPDLDAMIDGATQRPLPDDSKARMALRIALTQALVLGTPPHAAISTVLPLVDGGPRRLVHGVFGTLLRAGVTLPDAAMLPAGVAERWRAAWGEEAVAAAGRLVAQPPLLDLTLADAARTSEWQAGLDGKSLLPGHVRRAATAIGGLSGYDEGAWWVQDIAASIPARLIGAGPGVALDLCAAPGGKMLQLAAAGWQVTAIDESERRLVRLRENLVRARLEAKVVAADLTRWSPPDKADAILLDAPCSATGIYRRHPDVLYRARQSVIAETAALQRTLLDRAAGWLKPGGTLVYATCSLEPEEGEERIVDFLSRHPDYALVPVEPAELPAGVTPTSQGWLRLLPGTLEEQGGCDGFFVARLTRR